MTAAVATARSMRLWGGLEGMPDQRPYQLAYFVEHRDRWGLRSTEWRQIQGRMNRDRPERELGDGWHIYRTPSLVQSLGDGRWLEYAEQITNRGGIVGEIHLFFERKEETNGR